MDTFVWGAVTAVNALTFLAFGWDKWRAHRRGTRVPEATLLWLAFGTGVVGAWVAMSVFRHKTRKRGFRLVLILVTVCNPLWLLVWWRWTAAAAGA